MSIIWTAISFGAPVNINIEFEDISTAVLTPNEYQQLAQNLMATIPDLKFPNYRVIVTKTPANDKTDHDKREVYVTGNFYIADEHLNRQALASTFLHEYAHAVLESNLELRGQGLQKLAAKIETFRLATLKDRDAIKEIIARGKQTRDEKEAQNLMASAQEKLAQIKQRHQQIEIESGRFKLLISLHELFADLATIVVTGDPKSIAHAVSADRQAQHKKVYDVELRDFDSASSIKWETEKYVSYLSESVHSALLPARWQFWQTTKAEIQDPILQTQILLQAFEILSTEWNRILKIEESELSPRAFRSEILDEMNRRLSDAFAGKKTLWSCSSLF